MLVTATNPDGTGTAVSTPTALVPSSPPVNSARAGTRRRCAPRLDADRGQGTWSGIGNTYAYQWQRDAGVGFTDIAGATGANYTLAVADEGASVRVRVIATNPDGTLSVPSASTATVRAAPPVEHLAADAHRCRRSGRRS